MRALLKARRILPAVLGIALGISLVPGPTLAQTFSNQTTQLGLSLDDAPAAWGDYNNDGWVDLVADHRVWRNEAGAGFTLAFTLAPDLSNDDYDIWGDYNNDGYLDAVSWTGTSLLVFRNDAGAGFTQIPLPPLPMMRSKASAWGDFDGDGYVDLYVGGFEDSHRHGEPDVILTNDQGNSFTKTWEEVNPKGHENIKNGRGITACDFDQDADLDIYVSNYRLDENYLWRNDGTGVFTDAAEELGLNFLDPNVGLPGHTIGSAWGDLDNDGYFDLFEGNFSHNSYQKPSSFYRNLGPSGEFHFEDMTAGAGLAWQESYDTPALGDYDNDGDLDLYFTTVYSTGGNHPVLYRNEGSWHFTDVTAQAGLGGLVITEQAAWADFDRDGDLDLATDGKLFVNGGNSNRWMKVKLIGENGIGDVIGSQVRITDAYGTWTGQTRQVEAGTGQGNQNEMTLHFGFGPGFNDRVSLEVRWPDGSKSGIWEEFIMNGEVMIQKGLPWGQPPWWPPLPPQTP